MIKRIAPSPDVHAAAIDLLTACGQLVRRLRAESNNRELTWSQMAILSRLEMQGPMSIADLARSESVKPQSMGVALAVLEQDGYVERQPHPTDGRQFLFGLTPQGVEGRRRVRAAKQAWLAKAVATLTPEEQSQIAIAESVIRRLADSRTSGGL